MRAPLAEGAGWAAGLAAALALHLAAAALVLPRVAGLRDAPVQDAVFVDLEPAPPAPGFTPPEMMELPPLPADAMQPAPPPDFTPPDIAQLEPLPTEALIPPPPPDFTPPPLTELPPLDAFPAPSVLTLAVSERPQARPERRPDPPKAQPKARMAAPIKQAAPKAQRQAAPKRAAGGGGGSNSSVGKAAAAPSRGQIASWQAQVQSRIARHMQRTRLTGRASVRVSLSISVAGNGRVTARLASSTGNARMDRAITRQAARMPRLPAPPGGKPRNLVLPIRIN